MPPACTLLPGTDQFLVIGQLLEHRRSGPRGTPCPDTRSPGTSTTSLTDLSNANTPANTIRADRGELIAFAAHHDGGGGGELTIEPIRVYLSEIAGQAPSTRKRKRATVPSFCKWAVRH